MNRFIRGAIAMMLAVAGLTTATATTPAGATLPGAGPGGPILVVTDTNNPFSSYLSEILLGEGLNEFDAVDISGVDSGMLAAHDVAVVGEMPLSGVQATMFSDWVNAGGNLIAMRPDPDLALLLGITPAPGTLSDAYMQVNTAVPPGQGITGQSMQYHGDADRYTVSGATAVATLFSDATTATANPAVTLRGVGSNGGQAAAFTYDLARSVVTTRQGNPDWSEQERDGDDPIRPNDLFFGGSEPNWIDFTKAAIPQADEQQRLLANLITSTGLDRAPLPRFWYFPRGERAVVILTGDDHAFGAQSTKGRFDLERAEDPVGCVVADWECVRSTSYVYPNVPLTDADAAAAEADGFEVAVHVNTGCTDWDAASLESDYNAQLGAFATNFPSASAPETIRTHCIAWSDYDTQPTTEFAHGIRLDTNYYYHWNPLDPVSANPGFLTGSGMPQRFADIHGNGIDVYQAATQMTDESGQAYPATVNTLLDRATGASGYYGAFTVNAHTDSASSSVWSAVIESAQARGVPLVSAKQMLDWLDGRNASQFDNVAWDGTELDFAISADPRANGLQAMVPTQASNGAELTTLVRNGLPVDFDTEVRKGIEYAVFSGLAGNYAATFANDTTAPVVSGVSAVPHGDGSATISWSTDEAASSHVAYGTASGSLSLSADAPGLVTSHAVTLSGLSAGATYFFRVSSTDAASNTTTSPVPPATLQFTAPSFVATDTTVSEFAAGTLGACRTVAHAGNGGSASDGEVVLEANIANEFSAFPSGWVGDTFGGGSFSVSPDGQLVLNGGRVRPPGFQPPVRSMEFVATFTDDLFQHVGFADQFDGPPFAAFSTGSNGGSLKARTDVASGAAEQTTVIPMSLFDGPHRYRIDVNADNTVVFSIDGAVVVTQSGTFTQNLRPVASDAIPNGAGLSVDWLEVSPYGSSCGFESAPVDAGALVDWAQLTSVAGLPAGTAVSFETRTSSDASSWSAWAATSGGSIASPNQRYLQYRATLTTTDDEHTPDLRSVTVSATPVETVPPVTTMLVPSNNASVRGNAVFAASATDNVGVTGVAFLVSGGSFAADTPVATGTSSPYGWIGIWNTVGVPNGLYSVRSRATDAAGNLGLSAARTVRVDNTAPTVSMLVPSNNASVKGNAVVLDAGAFDNVAVTRVEFRATGGSLAANTLLGTGTSSPYGWIFPWNTDPLAQTTYQIRAVAFDAAGNTTTSAPINVTVDRTPPTTAVIVPSNNTTTVSGNAVLDASANDNKAVTHVQFRATGPGITDLLLGNATLTQYGWILIWDTTTRADGVYQVRSTAFDAAGNTTTSAPRTIRIDN